MKLLLDHRCKKSMSKLKSSIASILKHFGNHMSHRRGTTVKYTIGGCY